MGGAQWSFEFVDAFLELPRLPWGQSDPWYPVPLQSQSRLTIEFTHWTRSKQNCCTLKCDYFHLLCFWCHNRHGHRWQVPNRFARSETILSWWQVLQKQLFFPLNLYYLSDASFKLLRFEIRRFQFLGRSLVCNGRLQASSSVVSNVVSKQTDLEFKWRCCVFFLLTDGESRI